MLPVETKTLKAKLSSIYNPDQYDELERELGTSVYHHELFLEVLKRRRPDQSFEDLLKMNHPALSTVKREF